MSARLECAECGAHKRGEPLGTYEASPHDRPEHSRLLTLCGRCLRDRGAAWRTRWRISGRTLPGVRP